MTKTLRPSVVSSAASTRSIRKDDASEVEESPCSPFLRRWLGHHARRHKNLLLNIDAAGRIGLAPRIVGR